MLVHDTITIALGTTTYTLDINQLCVADTILFSYNNYYEFGLCEININIK